MVVFITGNANKLKEFQQIIGDFPVENRSIDLTEIQGTVEEVCTAKSKAVVCIGHRMIPDFLGETFGRIMDDLRSRKSNLAIFHRA